MICYAIKFERGGYMGIVGQATEDFYEVNFFKNYEDAKGFYEDYSGYIGKVVKVEIREVEDE